MQREPEFFWSLRSFATFDTFSRWRGRQTGQSHPTPLPSSTPSARGTGLQARQSPPNNTFAIFDSKISPLEP